SNQCLALQARLPGTHIHMMAKLEEARLARCIHIIGNRGAAETDSFSQHLLHRCMQTVEFRSGEPRGHPAWPDAGAEETLVGIDVANTMQQLLVKQRSLDRGATPVEEPSE